MVRIQLNISLPHPNYKMYIFYLSVADSRYADDIVWKLYPWKLELVCLSLHQICMSYRLSVLHRKMNGAKYKSIVKETYKRLQKKCATKSEVHPSVRNLKYTNRDTRVYSKTFSSVGVVQSKSKYNWKSVLKLGKLGKVQSHLTELLKIQSQNL